MTSRTILILTSCTIVLGVASALVFANPRPVPGDGLPELQRLQAAEITGTTSPDAVAELLASAGPASTHTQADIAAAVRDCEVSAEERSAAFSRWRPHFGDRSLEDSQPVLDRLVRLDKVRVALRDGSEAAACSPACFHGPFTAQTRPI